MNVSTQSSKRVPPVLRNILNKDVEITNRFVLWANQFLPFRQLRIHYKALELTCHGIPWFAFWICFTWLFNKPSLIQLQMNMLLGLLVDIILVATIKAYTRRKRPIANTDDALGQIGPDIYSFPSGHTSRAVLVAYIFIYLYPISIFFYLPLFAWVTSVSLSRILYGRHHILDVAAGIVLGLLEGILLGLLWIEEDSAKWFMWYLSDETLDGGSYHV